MRIILCHLYLITMDTRFTTRYCLPLFFALYVLIVFLTMQTLHNLSLRCFHSSVDINICPNEKTKETSSIDRRIILSPNTPTAFPRYGPGERGFKVNPDKLDQRGRKKIDEFYSFSTFVSDVISIHRKLNDIRSEECRNITYPSDLPPVSVIIIYRDELPSIVLRTAYSVLETTPSHLIKEIIFVDDGSEDPILRMVVDFHVDNVDKFKLVRSDKSRGLTTARHRGVEASTADYFVIFDGHMEVFPGWLEPLIDRLTKHPNSLLIPHMNRIDKDDFGIRFTTIDKFLSFDLINLNDQWLYYSQDYMASVTSVTEPRPFALYQGMATVMKKDFYFQLGGFDTGMEVWGYEQIELTLKVWMCGGRVEMMPCSKAAHMYRSTPWRAGKYGREHLKNKARMTAVWMDPPYKDFTYLVKKNKTVNTGYLADRHRIRIDNKCKPFSHYIDTVRSFSNMYFPESPKESGSIINAKTKLCLSQDYYTHELNMGKCNGEITRYFIYTEYSEVRTMSGRLLRRVDVKNATNTDLELGYDPDIHTDGLSTWKYKEDRTYVYNETGQCLTAFSRYKVGVKDCTGDQSQIWTWIPL